VKQIYTKSALKVVFLVVLSLLKTKEKEVQENLTLAYDSVETENKNKEVLECQLVTTS
jgi:hypothetical protein